MVEPVIDTESSATPPTTPASGRGLMPLVLAVLAVALAVFIGSQVVGVLYGMIFPAAPPRPDNLTELEHTSDAYGVDTWQYITAQDACQLVRFYEANGGTCSVAPTICAAGFIDAATITPGDHVAQCSGVLQFSIFAQKWEAVIATGYPGDEPTHFKLNREIYWTGEVPPSSRLEDFMPTAEVTP